MESYSMIQPVFLSASEPDPNRSAEYWESRQLLNVREAVRAFCAQALPHRPVVFGGHPAITPLVRNVADRVRHQAESQLDAAGGNPTRPPKILIYQSSFFVDGVSSDEVVVTPAHEADGNLAGPKGGTRNASLLRMRYEMLGRPNASQVHPLLKEFRSEFGKQRELRLGTYDFEAAIFIGGMEGVQTEFAIFRTFHPNTPAYPIATTGSACISLLDDIKVHIDPEMTAVLRQESAYSLVMQLILPALPSPDIARMAAHWRSQAWSKSYEPETHIDPPALDRPRRQTFRA